MDPDPDNVLGVLGYERTFSKSFLAELRACLADVASAAAAARVRLGLPPAARATPELERAAGAGALSAAQLKTFVAFCVQRYDAKRIEPGAPSCLGFKFRVRQEIVDQIVGYRA